jgi:hypothetical protein
MSTYIRWQGKVRETKTVVQILDLAHPDSVFTPDPHRWGVLCLDHSAAANFPTSQIAWTEAGHPLRWCTVCNGSATPVVEEAAACTHAFKTGATCSREAGHKGKHKPAATLQEQVDAVVEDAVAGVYNSLTAKGQHFMRLVGTHFFDFFDGGIAEHEGNWGSNMAGQAYGTIGVKETSMAGIMNGTLKAGLWTTTEDDQDAGNGLWWSLTKLGAAVANYAATQA